MKSFTEITNFSMSENNNALFNFPVEAKLWSINGGYIASAILRTVGSLSGEHRPASIEIDFLRPVTIGDASADVTTLSKSEMTSLYSVDLHQARTLCAQARLRTTLKNVGPKVQFAQLPHVPAPEELKELASVMNPDEPPLGKFWENMEQRPIARTKERVEPLKTLQRWFRYLREPKEVDVFHAMARTLPMIDTMGIPAGAQNSTKPFITSMAPTIRFGTQFHSVHPHDDWLFIETTCDSAEDGLINSSSKVFDKVGRLLATGNSQMLVTPKRDSLNLGRK